VFERSKTIGDLDHVVRGTGV